MSEIFFTILSMFTAVFILIVLSTVELPSAYENKINEMYIQFFVIKTYILWKFVELIY